MKAGITSGNRLVANDPAIRNSFRVLFGNDGQDYGEALRKHYDEVSRPTGRTVSSACTRPPIPGRFRRNLGALPAYRGHDWKPRCVRNEGEAARGARHIAAAIDFDPYTTRRWDQLIEAWLPIEFATNSLNRSMGLTDLYPFLLSPKAIEKLGFVHALTTPEAGVAQNRLGYDRAPALSSDRARTRMAGRCTVTRVPLPS